MPETDKLKRSIDTYDRDGVKALMTQDPALHRAPLGYGGDGPLTWVPTAVFRGNLLARRGWR